MLRFLQCCTGRGAALLPHQNAPKDLELQGESRSSFGPSHAPVGADTSDCRAGDGETGKRGGSDCGDASQRPSTPTTVDDVPRATSDPAGPSSTSFATPPHSGAISAPEQPGSSPEGQRSAEKLQQLQPTASQPLETKGWCDLQVPFEDITFHQLIGKGSFKQVYRGRWKSVNVAIVGMRRGGLVVEARLLQRLGSHPNLLQFYRWSTDLHGNEYILVEFMHFGSLDKCLANFGPSLRNRSKLLMCEQICHAMCELASEGVLHRDLAARNILVQSMQPVHVKVSDFGLARVAPAYDGTDSGRLIKLPGQGPDSGGPGQQAGAMGARARPQGAVEEDALVPVRWCAPEVLRTGGGWSEKSDVYSYGVCMWEIFMNGAEPYANRSDREAAAAIVRGELLPRPKNCPQPVYRLMTDCWQRDPAARPSFAQVAEVYRRWRESALAARAAAAVSGIVRGSAHGPAGPHGTQQQQQPGALPPAFSSGARGGAGAGPSAGAGADQMPGYVSAAVSPAMMHPAMANSAVLACIPSGEQLQLPDRFAGGTGSRSVTVELEPPFMAAGAWAGTGAAAQRGMAALHGQPLMRIGEVEQGFAQEADPPSADSESAARCKECGSRRGIGRVSWSPLPDTTGKRRVQEMVSVGGAGAACCGRASEGAHCGSCCRRRTGGGITPVTPCAGPPAHAACGSHPDSVETAAEGPISLAAEDGLQGQDGSTIWGHARIAASPRASRAHGSTAAASPVGGHEVDASGDELTFPTPLHSVLPHPTGNARAATLLGDPCTPTSPFSLGLSPSPSTRPQRGAVQGNSSSGNSLFPPGREPSDEDLCAFSSEELAISPMRGSPVPSGPRVGRGRGLGDSLGRLPGMSLSGGGLGASSGSVGARAVGVDEASARVARMRSMGGLGSTGNMNSNMVETCVLSMEVETAIDPMISCSTMASTTAAIAMAAAAAAAAMGGAAYPGGLRGTSGAGQRLSGSSVRTFLSGLERISVPDRLSGPQALGQAGGALPGVFGGGGAVGLSGVAGQAGGLRLSRHSTGPLPETRATSSTPSGSATPVSAPHGRPHPRPLGTHHVVRGVGGAAAADPACRSPATAAAAGAAAPTACSTADDGQPSPDGVRTLASMLPWPESTAAVVGAASLLPGREGYAGVSANASAAAASGGSPVEARRLQSRHSGLGGGAGGPGGHGGSSSGPGRGPGPPAPSGKLPGLVLPVQRAGSSAAAVQDNPYMTIGNLLYG